MRGRTASGKGVSGSDQPSIPASKAVALASAFLRRPPFPSLVLICLLFAAFGCREKAQNTALSLGQATDLALKLANDESEALYKCRPFTNGPPAKFIEGRWVWQTRIGAGQADLEASVKFESDGANPNVHVLWLDNRSTRQFRFR